MHACQALITDRERILDATAPFVTAPAPPKSQHEGSCGRVMRGLGKAMPTHPAGPGRETSRQEGTTKPWKHKKGKTNSRVQENPLSLASSEAFSANSKSWGAAAHKPWPLISSSERRKKKTVRKWVALRRLL